MSLFGNKFDFTKIIIYSFKEGDKMQLKEIDIILQEGKFYVSF